MPGEGEEVGAQLPYVHGAVGHGLGAVDHHQRPDGVRAVGDQPYRIESAEDVRLMGEGDDLRPLVEEFVDTGQIEAALVREPEPVQGRAGALRELLPGDEVRVVLHLRDHDPVARAEPVCVAQPVRDEVDALRGVLGEHDLVLVGTDEVRDRAPRALVRLRRLAGQLVGAAVHGGVVPEVEVPFGVQDLERFLRGGPGVEVDEPGTAVHRPSEDREVLAERVHIEGHGDSPLTVSWVVQREER